MLSCLDRQLLLRYLFNESKSDSYGPRGMYLFFWQLIYTKGMCTTACQCTGNYSFFTSIIWTSFATCNVNTLKMTDSEKCTICDIINGKWAHGKRSTQYVLNKCICKHSLTSSFLFEAFISCIFWRVFSGPGQTSNYNIIAFNGLFLF